MMKSTGTGASVHALRRPPSGGRGRGPGGLFDHVGAAVLDALPRSDQRRAGAAYLHGLLEADGRKSARNLAAHSREANEQSLHHFVNSSSWDWVAARRALAGRLAESWAPSAWVARPVLIPKSGACSVGVVRQFVPELGRSVNAQQAVGLWAASPALNCPVNWRLLFTHGWLSDTRRRERCAVPESVRPESLHESLVATVLEAATQWGLASRPVVLDIRGGDAERAVSRLRAAGLPVLVRIDPDQRLIGPSAPRENGVRRAATAREIHRALRGTRQSAAPWVERSASNGAVSAGVVVSTGRVRLIAGSAPAARAWGAAGSSAAAAGSGLATVTPIGRRVTPAAGGGDLSLLAIEERGAGEPQLWLTDLVDTPLSALRRMTALIHQVDEDFVEIGDQVGLRDFTGRSFVGWHRHITLASAAYAVAALGRAQLDGMVPEGSTGWDERRFEGTRAA
jgi:SRSO17 transposase